MDDDPQTVWEPDPDAPEAPYEAGDPDMLPWIPAGDPQQAPRERGDTASDGM